MLEHAETFRLQQLNADPESQSIIFTQAMLAAANMRSNEKVVEYADYALTADPNNLSVLILLAGSNMPDPKKAMEHAQKAATVPRPATMSDSSWQVTQSRVHSILGGFYFAESKWKEANAEFALALKANPKDHVTQYRAGFASANLMAAAAQAAQTANTAAAAATTAKANAITIAELTAKQEGFSKEALEHRDAAIEFMAKAAALGGQFASQAKQLLDGMYQNKHNSLEGEDLLIAQKKTELGL